MAMPKLRWMVERDMSSVLEIERLSFSDPWTKEEFYRQLRQQACLGSVAEVEDRVVAFAVWQLAPKVLRLANIAVHPEFRRRRIAAVIVDHLIGKLESPAGGAANRRERMVLEVRETNLAAQKFFRAAGFRARAVAYGYYEDTGEDAYVMEYRLGSVPANRIRRYLASNGE